MHVFIIRYSVATDALLKLTISSSNDPLNTPRPNIKAPGINILLYKNPANCFSHFLHLISDDNLILLVSEQCGHSKSILLFSI